MLDDQKQNKETGRKKRPQKRKQVRLHPHGIESWIPRTVDLVGNVGMVRGAATPTREGTDDSYERTRRTAAQERGISEQNKLKNIL